MLCTRIPDIVVFGGVRDSFTEVYVWNADDELFAPPSKEGPKRPAAAA